MKKLLLSFCLWSMVSYIAKSQPTITSDNQLAIGDYFVSQSSYFVPGEGGSGPNQTWDFTSVDANGGSVTLNVIDPSTTPFASSFPTASVAIDDGTSLYSYYTNSSTETDYIGYGYYGETLPYTDNHQFFVYPFTYNTTFTDNFAASGVINGFYTARYGTVTFDADA